MLHDRLASQACSIFPGDIVLVDPSYAPAEPDDRSHAVKAVGWKEGEPLVEFEDGMTRYAFVLKASDREVCERCKDALVAETRSAGGT